MSVINKMLRDLDARRVEGALPDLPRELRSAAMQGTMSVAGRAPALVSRRLSALLALLLLALLACAAWYGQEMVAGPTPQDAVPAPAVQAEAAPPEARAASPAAVNPPLAAASASAVSTPVSTQEAGAVAAMPERPATVAVQRETAPAQRPPVSAAPPVSPPASRPTGRPGPEAAPTTASPALRPGAPQSVPAPAASAAPAPSADLALQRRISALQETLAQAQNLWAAGSREAAVELMREAVVVAERVPATDAELPVLVRELARMELALGRSAAVLDLLVRLEPRLGTQADLWAVRGNAAQRLGRHQDSVQAYRAALQLSPGEPRWMLGAAVSLAALGQLEAAAQQAEQARALGPVSPEVLAYLRQAGVPLR